ncbi:MAG TPA: GWxTD domain-containing protein [Pyrinomonadaceae bacterium]|nr:GWxTD domain-containing protein [Pyrinomonadaceae bacterium]
MKNKFLAFAILIFSCFFAVSTAVKGQHSSVSFNKKGISVVFKVETSTPETTKQTFGSVYFTGYDETEKESRVHRVLADRESGLYFGYDLVIESGSEPNKFKVSFRPLSMTPPETLRLSDLTMRSLPKYPEDLTVEDGDTIALDLLYNPQTKVKIVDLIKITTKKPQSSDTSLFTTTASSSGFGTKPGTGVGASSGTGTSSGTGVSSGSGTSGGLFSKPAVRDFTPDDVKMRLTSPKLLINGSLGAFRGSEWKGIIEGSVIYFYIPGKGRFIFSLFPHNNFNFQKNAALESNKITFDSNGERFELISDEPIVNGGGDWNLWVLSDPDFKPNMSFNSDSTDFVQYGAAGSADHLLTRNPQTRRTTGSSTVQRDLKAIYQKWLNEDVRYIISEEEKQAFSRLNTNEEREQFVESFWQRRDAKPETEENEFRREYYGRIAYANQNLGFGKTAGWLTDRGRIFITHGKPDEIQKNGAEEVWIYKSLPELGANVRFEFVDAANNGDFRLRK